jgi:hypothetical protein
MLELMRSRATLIPLSLSVCPWGALILKRVIAVPVAREEINALCSRSAENRCHDNHLCVMQSAFCRVASNSQFSSLLGIFQSRQQERCKGSYTKKSNQEFDTGNGHFL